MIHGSDGIRTATRPMTLYGHPSGMFASFRPQYRRLRDDICTDIPPGCLVIFRQKAKRSPSGLPFKIQNSTFHLQYFSMHYA